MKRLAMTLAIAALSLSAIVPDHARASILPSIPDAAALHQDDAALQDVRHGYHHHHWRHGRYRWHHRYYSYRRWYHNHWIYR